MKSLSSYLTRIFALTRKNITITYFPSWAKMTNNAYRSTLKLKQAYYSGFMEYMVQYLPTRIFYFRRSLEKYEDKINILLAII
ncbi:hypothetical protein BAY32_07775 [Elizabethkingia ursingii]|uniref:Uncharacterized protein n=1 Tax=Elizabethkingia ursingii TaxID=1756150 RepID=A0AAJ3TPQ5_9FLAO|nr:hypothetical protein BBD34_14025 [Elizabethkingia ursingii]OPB75420.1 hypothetical protein BAY32_07775 [Elizabethkingia ursingii]